MKKILFSIILLSFLSSCTMNQDQDKDAKIRAFETQIQALQEENTRLKWENELLKIGGIPSSIQTTPVSSSTTVMDNSLFPEWTTFEETNGADCMKKARDMYISEWIKKCKSLGYTDAQIQKDECQLDTSYIKTLEKQRTDAEAACGPQ